MLQQRLSFLFLASVCVVIFVYSVFAFLFFTCIRLSYIAISAWAAGRASGL